MSERLAMNNMQVIEELHHKIIKQDKKIDMLKNKLNETITMLNFVSLYYETKGDYAGCLLEVE